MTTNIETKYGNFHTHANLTQALTGVIQQHYTAVQAAKGEGQAQPMPQFVSEAIHMICRNLATVANHNIYDLQNWEEIAQYATLVENTIANAQAQAREVAEQAAKSQQEEEDLEEVPDNFVESYINEP